jgi:hypothetical protein
MALAVSFMSSFSLDHEAKGNATKEEIPSPNRVMKFLLSMSFNYENKNTCFSRQLDLTKDKI